MIKKIFWYLLVTSIIWGDSLPGINIPALGTLFPLRIIIIASIAFLYLNLKKEHTFNDMAKNTVVIWLIMLTYGLFTFFWAINLSEATSTWLIYVTNFMVMVLCIFFIKDLEDVDTIAKAYLLNICIISFLAIYESLSGNYIFNNTVYDYTLPKYNNSIGLNPPLVFFYNINNLATFMVLSIPMCFIAFYKSNLSKVKTSLIFILVSIVVFLSDSRAAMLGIVIFLILYLFFYMNLKNMIGYVFLFFVAIFSFGNLIKTSSVWSVFSSSIGDETRTPIWINTIKNIGKNYFIGVGPGNSTVVNSLYMFENTFGIYNTHNYLLEIFFEFGLIGIICIMFWLIKLTIENRRKERLSSTANKYYFNLTYIYIFMFLVTSILPSTMNAMYFIWLNFGISVALININIEKEANL